MAIQVYDISLQIAKEHILDKISFETQGIIALLGQNGAGKSSLMKVLTGYQFPTSGTATVAGFNIINNTLEAQNRIGYLPEHNPLYLELYVREYLEQVAQLRKVPLARVEIVIQETGLTQAAHKKIKTLSKGYRQRVGLAQAILHEPQVLILDEPTTGLDPNQIIEIRNLIKNIGQSKTILLSTHILQEVEAICNQLIILHYGKIVAHDTVESIIAQYGSVEQAFYQLTH